MKTFLRSSLARAERLSPGKIEFDTSYHLNCLFRGGFFSKLNIQPVAAGVVYQLPHLMQVAAFQLIGFVVYGGNARQGFISGRTWPRKVNLKV